MLTEKRWFIYALVPICALFWGLSFLGTSVTLAYVDVIPLLALRWTLAAVFFLVMMAFGVVKPQFRGKKVWLVLLCGLLQPCIYSIFETYGVKLTTPSESSIFIATIPLVVLLIGMVVLREKVTLRTIVAIIIAFVGVVVCIYFSPGFSLGGKGSGYLFLVGAVITGAMYTIASNRVSAQFSSVEVTFLCAMVATVFFNAVSFGMGYGITPYITCFTNIRVMIGVLFLGICCSSLCWLIFNYVLGKMSAAIASNLVANSTTAVGVVAGCVFAGDPFGWFTVVGVTMTIGGICLASVKSGETRAEEAPEEYSAANE